MRASGRNKDDLLMAVALALKDVTPPADDNAAMGPRRKKKDVDYENMLNDRFNNDGY